MPLSRTLAVSAKNNEKYRCCKYGVVVFSVGKIWPKQCSWTGITAARAEWKRYLGIKSGWFLCVSQGNTLFTT